MTDKKRMPDEEGQVPRVSRCNALSAKKAARRCWRSRITQNSRSKN